MQYPSARLLSGQSQLSGESPKDAFSRSTCSTEFRNASRIPNSCSEPIPAMRPAFRLPAPMPSLSPINSCGLWHSAHNARNARCPCSCPYKFRLRMAVRTDQAQVVELVIQRIAVRVIQFKRRGPSHPFRDTADLATMPARVKQVVLRRGGPTAFGSASTLMRRFNRSIHATEQ